MSVLILLGFGVVVLLSVTAVLLVRWLRPASGEPAAPLLPAATRWRWSGAAAGVIGAVVVGRVGTLGEGLPLAVPVFCLGMLAGVIGGELAVRSPRTAVRTASVRVRRTVDYLPRRLAVTVATAVVALAGVLGLTTALGSPDDMGRAGRSLARACDELSSVATGPWPGYSYTAPLALVLGAGLVAAAAALQVIVRRPRTADLGDDGARHLSAQMVLGATGVLVAVPALGICAVAAAGLLSFPCPTPSWSIIGWTLAASVPVWLAVLVGCAAAVLAPRVPAPAPALA